VFDLRTSPFYLLGVSPRDNREIIAQATETALAEGTLDEAVATRAQQILMSPRLRLGAELSWLLGLAPNRVRHLIEETRLDADTVASLPLLAGANLAAHRCSTQISPPHDELLFRFYGEHDDDEILNLLNTERRASGFPAVTAQLLQESIPTLMHQHTLSFVNFIGDGSYTAQTILRVLTKYFIDGSKIVAFLDDIVDRFDEREAGSFQRAEASITECLNSIQAAPDSLNEHLSAFSAAIAEWSSVAAPRQFILARRHVNDPRSEQLLGKIRGVCLRLHNDLGDAKTALALTKAAAPAFEASPGHLQLVKADVETLEERVVTQDAVKATQPLIDFVTDLKTKHGELCASIRRGNFRQDGNGVAGNLFHLFRTSAIELSCTPASEAPFRVILSLAIDLHNNSEASEEALILVRALQAFSDVPKDDQLIEALRANGLIAHRTILQKNLTCTAQARRHRQSARLAQELADTATDEDERAGWTKLRLEFDRRAKVQTWKYAAIAVGVGGFFLLGIIQDNSRISPSSKAQSQYREPSIQDYNEAIRINPSDPVAYYHRAFAYANIAQYDRAIQDYNEAIRLNPNYAAAFHGRAIAYAKKEQYNRAIDDYDQTLRLDQNNAGAFHNRGLAYSYLNQYDRAIQDYDKALSLNPRNASTLDSRGLAYARKGDFDKAIADYNESIGINSQNTYAFSDRGFAFSRTGNFDSAIQDYDRAIQIDAGNFVAFFGRGMAYAKKGQFEACDSRL
jgi:tetratricopeptide (TPR) repeat protein